MTLEQIRACVDELWAEGLLDDTEPHNHMPTDAERQRKNDRTMRDAADIIARHVAAAHENSGDDAYRRGWNDARQGLI